MAEEAGAAARQVGADRLGVAGAVDRELGVAAALIEIEHAGAERIVEAGRHAVGILGRLGLALDHLRRRRPDRPFGLAPDIGLAAPQEALTADVRAIARGIAVAFDAVDEIVLGIDDDGADRFAAVVFHGLAIILRVDLADVGRRNREFLVGHRPIHLLRRRGNSRPSRNPTVPARLGPPRSRAETNGG